MSWLFPLYLAAGIAVGLPIWLHLRRRPPKRLRRFSSVQFVPETAPRPTERRQIQRWLLLLLRCLLLIALAALFARPWWNQGTGSEGGGEDAMVILLDRSASMQRGDLWARGVDRVNDLLASAGDEDRIAVAVFDRNTQRVWGFEDEGGEVRRSGVKVAMENLDPGAAGTDLGRCLLDAANWLAAEPATGQRQVVLISDLQVGATLEGLKDFAWPDHLPVRVEVLEAPQLSNVTVSLVPELETDEGRSEETGPTVRLQAGQMGVDYRMGWKGSAEGGGIQGSLKRGQRRVVSTPLPPESQEGASWVLQGDRWPLDNEVHIAPRSPRAVRLRVLDAEGSQDRAGSPAFYLQRALSETTAMKPLWVSRESDAEDAADVWIKGDRRLLTDSEVRDWRARMEEGGLGVFVVTDGTSIETLSELTRLEWTEQTDAGDDRRYALIESVKSEDPLMEPFRDARLADLSRVRFWNRRLLDVADERVTELARWDSGETAIWKVEVGEGTLLVLGSGWHPEDSQLALSSKFVPLWYGWLAAVGFERENRRIWFVGDELVRAEGGPVEIVSPDGGKQEVAPGEGFVATAPGLHRIRQGEESWWRAVQFDPREGRLEPMDPQLLSQRWGVVLQTEQETDTPRGAQDILAQGRGLETEQRQQVWWWLALLAAAVAIAESLVATGGKKIDENPAPSA